MTQIHDLGSDTICRTVRYVIPPENQFVMRKTLKSFMAIDIMPREPAFRMVVGSQIMVPPTNHKLGHLFSTQFKLN